MNKYLKKAENSSGIDHYVRVPGTGAKQKITFTKMHGCANDYVYIDCFQNDIQNYAELAIYLSDRHTGIGGDGVIYICPSDVADARMRMYNLDGSEGMMCGNGIRCVAKYVYDSGIAKKDVLHIETKKRHQNLPRACRKRRSYHCHGRYGQSGARAREDPGRFPG